MIIISSRKVFDDPDHISVDGHHIREINLNTDKKLRDKSLSTLKNELKNKRISFWRVRSGYRLLLAWRRSKMGMVTSKIQGECRCAHFSFFN